MSLHYAELDKNDNIVVELKNIDMISDNMNSEHMNIDNKKHTNNKSPQLKQKIQQNNNKSLYDLILVLENKYKDNEYITSRLYHHIETLLPTTLETEYKIQQQREERKRQLSDKRDEFIERFLHTHRYFYCQHSELFIHYDGKHFNGYSEDEILHKIHLLIVSEQSLMVWKYKIKNNIMKQVREKSPFTAIPESETIQFVINGIYPSIFQTRNNAKYFLTIIGECIMNDNNSKKNIYITSPNMKILLDELAEQLDNYFGLPYSFHNIKYKYYDHDYSLCRLIPFPKKPFSVPYHVSKYIFDFLCVSTHYFSRYGSSDNFLSQCGEPELLEYSHFICKNTPDKIVDMFIDTTIKKCVSATATINTKNILFIWKKFLEERNVPNVILHGPLKKILKEKIQYNSETDMFIDVTSVHLPIVSQFIHFWDTYITEDENEPEFEIDELMRLFRKTNTKQKNISTESKMTDSLMIELIKHFYPDMEILEDKYIMNIRCSLWDKREEVKKTLELFRIKERNNLNAITPFSLDSPDVSNSPYISNTTYISNNYYIQSSTKSLCIKSLYDAYEFYCNSNNGNECLVSKRYFEKMARELIGEYLEEDGVISNSYF
jgi:hypothetical protein